MTNGQRLPPLSHRRLQMFYQSNVFAKWGKIAIFLEEPKAKVYSRILKEGGATDVKLLSMPFQRKHMFAGIEEVEDIQYAYILSEPALVQSDQIFRYFVRSNHANVHVCSYLYVIECLCKVSLKGVQNMLRVLGNFLAEVKKSYRG